MRSDQRGRPYPRSYSYVGARQVRRCSVSCMVFASSACCVLTRRPCVGSSVTIHSVKGTSSMRQGVHTGPAESHPRPESAPACLVGPRRRRVRDGPRRADHRVERAGRGPLPPLVRRRPGTAVGRPVRLRGVRPAGAGLDRLVEGRSCNEVLRLTVDGGRPVHLTVTCSSLVGGRGDPVLLCNVSDLEPDRLAETQMAFMDELMRDVAVRPGDARRGPALRAGQRRPRRHQRRPGAGAHRAAGARRGRDRGRRWRTSSACSRRCGPVSRCSACW